MFTHIKIHISEFIFDIYGYTYAYRCSYISIISLLKLTRKNYIANLKTNKQSIKQD